jgi:hypothetical protein
MTSSYVLEFVDANSSDVSRCQKLNNEISAWVNFSTASPLTLDVVLPVNAKDVCVSFDPVSLEDARQTRELNQMARLGFVPISVPTR